MYYSLLEQHVDGAWWYHPGLTVNKAEMVEEVFKDRFIDRPKKIIHHETPLYQTESTYTIDMKHFYGKDRVLKSIIE